MTGPGRTQRLQFMFAALVLLMVLWTSARFMEKHWGPSPTPKAAKAAQVEQDSSAAVLPVRATTTPGSEASPADSSPGPLPATPVGALPSWPVAPLVRVGEAVGRTNPFAAPGISPPASRPNAPSPRLDLPLPPGAPSGGSGASSLPPGAGMAVGAIVGGSERIAIIQAGGQTLVVGVGDRVVDAAVVEILADKVVLQRGEDTFELLYAGGSSESNISVLPPAVAPSVPGNTQDIERCTGVTLRPPRAGCPGIGEP